MFTTRPHPCIIGLSYAVAIAAAAALATCATVGCNSPTRIDPQTAGAGRSVAQGASTAYGDIGAGAQVITTNPTTPPAAPTHTAAALAAGGVCVTAIVAFAVHLYRSHRTAAKPAP